MRITPRGSTSGLVAFMALSLLVQGQDAKSLEAEIKKVESRIAEETERAAKKKESVKVEFEALQRPQTRKELADKLAAIGGRHRQALAPKPAGPGEEAASRPSPPESLRADIEEECRGAVAATVGRNLAVVLAGEIASNMISLLRGDAPVDYALVVNETVDLVFEGTDFETNYRKLVPTFEKTLVELQGELAGLKRRREDLAAAERARALGAPPGMVLVPGGKYRIGSDAKEFEAIRKELRFGPEGGIIDKHALGWPPHEVTLDDFYIDVNEVTNRYWAEFVRDTGRKPPKYWGEIKKKRAKQKAKEKEQASVAPNGKESEQEDGKQDDGAADGGALVPEGMEDLPVTFVTPDDIAEYAEWVGRRIPLEYEWEAAARYRGPGDKSHRWWTWGDTYDLHKPFANNQTAAAHPKRDPETQLTPVGTFPEGRSFLGINDLVGNAAEWTASTFTPYPGWQESKVPSSKGGEAFNPSQYVIRGGTALAPELYTLTTTRTAMREASAQFVGFRTALSKARGKDFLQSIAGGHRLVPALAAVGPALKDEKSGKPQLALDDDTRFTGLIAGGWDYERNLPARAHHIAVVGRDTMELIDGARVKSMARELKKPLMIGYLHSAVGFKKPEVPKGAYWIVYSPGRTKIVGKEKHAIPESFALQSVTNPEDIFEIPNVNPPVLVPKSTEPTKLTVGKDGSELNVLLSFPVRDRKTARFFVEFRLETEPGALKAFK